MTYAASGCGGNYRKFEFTTRKYRSLYLPTVHPVRFHHLSVGKYNNYVTSTTIRGLTFRDLFVNDPCTVSIWAFHQIAALHILPSTFQIATNRHNILHSNHIYKLTQQPIDASDNDIQRWMLQVKSDWCSLGDTSQEPTCEKYWRGSSTAMTEALTEFGLPS